MFALHSRSRGKGAVMARVAFMGILYCNYACNRPWCSSASVTDFFDTVVCKYLQGAAHVGQSAQSRGLSGFGYIREEGSEKHCEKGLRLLLERFWGGKEGKFRVP